MYPAPWVLTTRDTDGAAALLNLRTGQWHLATHEVGLLWKLLGEGVEPEEAFQEIASAYGVGLDTVRAKMGSVLRDLAQAGLLTHQQRPAWRLARTGAGPEVLTPPPSSGIPDRDGGPTLRYRMAATVGFASAIVVLPLMKHLRLPFWMLLGIVRVTRCIAPRDPSLVSIEALAETVERIAARFARAECLESSVATLFAGALLGAAPHWCLGARFRPLVPHAWVEGADGIPVGSGPHTPDRPCRVALRI